MILVCPTDFKGTIRSGEAASAMARGVRAAGLRPVERPLSDGGPGLIDALRTPPDPVEQVHVTGPLGAPVRARLLWQGMTAILESADACGLHLTLPPYQPWRATTHGVGELIAHASTRAREIVVGLGGSATVDAGIGMAAALGWRFLSEEGRELAPYASELSRISGIEAPADRNWPAVLALADVDTPLAGPAGAARVFGPQKGVGPTEVEVLDAAFQHLADVVERDLGLRVRDVPGAGAAGGLGAALVAFLGARITGGSDWVLQHIGFAACLADARLVITGEGRYDEQSALGKITGVVIEHAGARGIPVLLVAGRITGAVPPHVTAVSSPGEPLTPQTLERIVHAHCARLLPS